MANRLTKFKLNTGAEIPALGFGTWQDEAAQEDAVTHALKTGYRHIDTAAAYGTEPAIGNAIKKSGIPRDQLFITSKLWNHKHHPADVEAALNKTLKDLGVSYVDLYLIHFPVAFARGDDMFPKDAQGKMKTQNIDYVDTWLAMEKLAISGKTKAIGISNFSKAETERLLQKSTITPAVHQLELHPWLQQRDFVKYLRDKGIHVSQYSPLGNQNPAYNQGKVGLLVDDPVLVNVGRKYGKTPAQVALAWGINQGHSVIVKSKTPARIEQNFQSDFQLKPEDVNAIEKIDKKVRFNDSTQDFNYKLYSDLEGSSK